MATLSEVLRESAITGMPIRLTPDSPWLQFFPSAEEFRDGSGAVVVIKPSQMLADTWEVAPQEVVLTKPAVVAAFIKAAKSVMPEGATSLTIDEVSSIAGKLCTELGFIGK